MIIRNTIAGDWTFGQGRQNFLITDRAIAENIRTRLQCFLADCSWSMGFGIDWWNLLGSRNPTAEVGIILQCRQMVAESFGVVTIQTIEAKTDVSTRLLTLVLVIDTIYSKNTRIALAIAP